MKKNKTEIVIVLDSSGSMATIAGDMEGGLKSYLNDQKNLNGECSVTYYKFSDKVTRVFENVPVSSVEDIKLTPRGNTALFDGIGTAINEVGTRLANTPKNERPELIIVPIITDGQENVSKEFTKEKIGKMIKHQEDKYNWQFLFLGTNFDAFAAGQNYGFKAGKSMSYGNDTVAINNTFSVLSSTTNTMRLCSNKEDLATYEFSEKDRAKVK